MQMRKVYTSVPMALVSTPESGSTVDMTTAENIDDATAMTGIMAMIGDDFGITRATTAIADDIATTTKTRTNNGSAPVPFCLCRHLEPIYPVINVALC